MNENLNPLFDPSKYKKELYGFYREIFSKVIKETFLINMLNRIDQDVRYCNLLMQRLSNSLTSKKSIMIGEDTSNISVCKMIVMSHYIHTVVLNDSERGKLQNDNNYKTRLVEEVVDMYQFEKLADADFKSSSIELYLPLIYYISAINNYCCNKYDEIVNNKIQGDMHYNIKFNLTIISKMLMKIKACISLADIRATDELIAVFRTLIETFFTFMALWDESDFAIDSFYEYDKVSSDFNYTGEVPEKYKKMSNGLDVSIVSFINYGWLLNLTDFHCMPKTEQKPKIGSLAKYLDKKYRHINSEFGTSLYSIYKTCNPQAHGTLLYMNYFQLELSVFQNIAVMLKYICEKMSMKLFCFGFNFGTIDLIDKLNEALSETRKVSERLLNNQELIDKTNLDYRDRVFCSIKLKN